MCAFPAVTHNSDDDVIRITINNNKEGKKKAKQEERIRQILEKITTQSNTSPLQTVPESFNNSKARVKLMLLLNRKYSINWAHLWKARLA